MSRFTKYLTILVIVYSFHPAVAASSDAATTIESFYRDYVKSYAQPSKPHHLIKPPLSRSLQSALEENDRTCKQKAESECGYGMGNSYLAVSALEETVDQSRFSFEKANFRFTMLSPKVIQVDFDIPVLSQLGGESEHRTMIYLMVKEGNQWVVDDIIHIDKNERNSLREQAWSETVHLLLHPEK